MNYPNPKKNFKTHKFGILKPTNSTKYTNWSAAKKTNHPKNPRIQKRDHNTKHILREQIPTVCFLFLSKGIFYQ